MKKYTVILTFILMFVASNVYAVTVKYKFDINTKTVNFTGKPVIALAINNQIPGPIIEATVGDTLEVTFNNKMDVETSIHWHGILLPNKQDGVPYLTTQPIAPHSTFTYRYKITHAGTYWYHSHTGLQEQRGVYGSLVFHPKNGERIKTDHDYVVVLSDWTNENPKQVLANLKKDGDYYALKKDSVQSWDKVIKNGSGAIKKRLQGSWSRMGPMDLSDVSYDAFLANGQQKSRLKASAGDTVRIRLINAGASSYFNVEFAGSPMTIVASDGVDVEPIKVQRLRIAIAETYDIIVPIAKHKSHELRATAEDGTGYSSVFIGFGTKVLAPNIPRPNLFTMGHSMPMSYGNMKHSMKAMSHSNVNQQMQHAKHKKPATMQQPVIAHMKNYQHLRATHNTELAKAQFKRKITLNLTGNMERYVWGFNNKILIESDKILIKKGEIVQITLQNKTMMHHPIHLHGHFFRVLNGQGKRSPLKHTVNVAPMNKIVIEFKADEEKDWFFHCHNLYHMKAGMARVVSYQGSTKATLDTFAKLAHDDWYLSTDITALSNMTMGIIRASNTRNAVEIEYDYNYNREYDVEVVYARSPTRFFDIYAGGNFEREAKDAKSESTAIFGVRYMLPLLLESNLRINSKGKVRLSLCSDLQLTERTKFEWSHNTDREYRFNLAYELNKKVLLAATYDSAFKYGVGLRVKL